MWMDTFRQNSIFQESGWADPCLTTRLRTSLRARCSCSWSWLSAVTAWWSCFLSWLSALTARCSCFWSWLSALTARCGCSWSWLSDVIAGCSCSWILSSAVIAEWSFSRPLLLLSLLTASFSNDGDPCGQILNKYCIEKKFCLWLHFVIIKKTTRS